MADSESSKQAVPSQNGEPSAKTLVSMSPSFMETSTGRKIAYDRIPGSSPGVVYLHGLCSNMNSVRGDRLAKYCTEKGVGYLRFDLPGHGRSSESLDQCTISSWLEDVAETLDTLTSGVQIIVGDALGGWLMFLHAFRNPDKVYGLVGIAPAVDFTQRLWKGLSKDTRLEFKRNGKYPFPSPTGEEPVVLTIDMIVDGEKHSILDMPGLELLKSPTWLLHGANDTMVPPNISIKLMQSMQCPVELKVVEGGDHLLHRPEELELLVNAIDSLLSASNGVVTESSGNIQDNGGAGGEGDVQVADDDDD